LATYGGMTNAEESDQHADGESADEVNPPAVEDITPSRRPPYRPNPLRVTGSKTASEALAEDREDRELIRRPRPD
jgi:hypothetical protein